MADKTAIEWADATWNPLRARPELGRWYCQKISPGCDNCYASRLNKRFGGWEYPGSDPHQRPVYPVVLNEKALMQPHHWRQPRVIFVCSMTDIAGEWVTFEWFHALMTVMAETPRHTYQVLTKRPTRLKALIERFQEDAPGFGPYPLPNVWIGTTIESDRYVWRANVLRQTPAAVRFVSAEPLLTGLPSLDLAGIDWLIGGGESGGPPDRRLVDGGPYHKRCTHDLMPKPLAVEWARDLRDRCLAAGTAFFWKQWGGLSPKSGGRLLDGRTWDQYPVAAATPTTGQEAP
jgi:protein gp37